MRWNASGRACGLIAAWIGMTAMTPARGDDPPPLLPPAGSPGSPEGPKPATTPPQTPAAPPSVPAPAPAPTPRGAANQRDGRPVLALPGVTAPRTARPAPLPPPTLPPPSLAPSSDGGLPMIDPPGRPPLGPAASGTGLMPLPSSRFQSRVIESTPFEQVRPNFEPPPLSPPSGRPAISLPPLDAPRRPGDPLLLEEPDGPERRGMDELDKAKPKDKPRDPAPAPPSRRPGLFGGRFNLLTPPRGGMPTDVGMPRDGSEPRSDPAADAAIKRRVERQAREAVGDRAKSVDVRVVGKTITIQARGVKFLLRRPVRRSLEGLPGLSGYHSHVDVLD